MKSNNAALSRKDFLKLAGLGAGSAIAGGLFAPQNLIAAPVESVRYARPATLPTVIHVFLYGGASELGGNFTNRQEIYNASVNPYPGGVSVTPNGFWEQAGGAIMEDLLDSEDLTVYRTIHRRKDDHKGHKLSQTQNLVGNLDDTAAGIATTLAAVLERNDAINPGDALFPFVTLEGDSDVFLSGSLRTSFSLKPVALSANLDNPFEHRSNPRLSQAGAERLDELARQVSGELSVRRSVLGDLQKIFQFFSKRKSLADFVANLRTRPLPAGVAYPTDNPMADRLRTAVNIAVHNPDTRFISIGNGGIGGWDAHSDAIGRYTRDMTRVMEALRAAVQHMKAAGQEHRIVIQVHGDFGRNVNLNNSRGWDHGNNQNLFVLGGKAFQRGGRIAGRTKLIGSAERNRLFTAPADGSPEWEPFSIASSIYNYFGVQNPEVLTGEPVLG